MTTVSFAAPARAARALLCSPARMMILGLGAFAVVGMGRTLGVLAVEAPAAALTLLALLGLSVAIMLVLLSRLLPAGMSAAVGAAAVAWGVAATLYAEWANGLWAEALAGALAAQPASPWSGGLAAGPVEETSKLLGLALISLAWPRSVEGTHRGLVLGMLIGLGFGIQEHAYHLATVAALGGHLGGPVEAVVQGFLSRTLAAGLYFHVAFTGLTGGALGWALASRSRYRWLGPMVAVAGLSVLHALANGGPLVPPPPPWDASQVPTLLVVGALRSLPFVLTLALLARQSRRRDADGRDDHGGDRAARPASTAPAEPDRLVE